MTWFSFKMWVLMGTFLVCMFMVMSELRDENLKAECMEQLWYVEDPEVWCEGIEDTNGIWGQ